MKRIVGVCAVGIVGLVCVALAPAQDPAGPSNAEVICVGLVKQQISALNVENPQGVMLVFHPEAPNRNELHRTIVEQFRRKDLRFKLVSSHFVAEDGKWAYMRVVQQVSGGHTSPKPFKGETEELLVFKRYKHMWKAWTSARLSQRSLTKGPQRR
jgi:hypothetical protein